MKLKRIIKSIFIPTIIVMAFFISCSRDRKYESIKFKKLLIDKIQTKINNPNRIEIIMKDLTDFKWDSFIVIPPYTKLSLLENELKLNLKKVECTEIEKRDDINVLVFIQNGQVIKFVEYPRWPGDFSELGKIKLYAPNDAIFIVEETNEFTSDGKNRLILKDNFN
jgi:hypothetical protein